MRIVKKVIGGLSGLALIAEVVLAFFIKKIDEDGSALVDGFGRELVKSPPWEDFISVWGFDEYWAGLGWFAVDSVIIAILALLLHWSSGDS